MSDPINERDLFGTAYDDPMTLAEWLIVLGLLTGVVVAIIFTVRAFIG